MWKATYRVLLGEEGRPPMIQGWAVVDNTQDEDWENVELSLIAGLPVSFVHDLYTPRYVRRPTVAVEETTGVLPPMMEEAVVEADMPLGYGGAPAALSAAAAPMRKQALQRVRAAPVSAVSSVQTQVRERQVGELFEYAIERPVTVRRNQSALVPIVLKEFDAKRVLLYQKHARPENPLRCLEFTNTTGLTLEGGPVTVLDAGSYVGEAMLDTTRPRDHRLLAYAVELAVRVTDSIESHEEKVRRVTIRKGVLKARSDGVSQTTYTFRSRSQQQETVYLDHPRDGSQWRLFDTPPPHEMTENYWRFRFTLEANQALAFVVRKRVPVSQQYALSEQFEQHLHGWLEQKYLDAPTAKALTDVAGHYRHIADAARQMQQLQMEREQIHTEQTRIRGNLGALGDRPDEKALRSRMVRTLEQQENRLEEIDREVKKLTSERDEARQRAEQALAKLEYEGEVG